MGKNQTKQDLLDCFGNAMFSAGPSHISRCSVNFSYQAAETVCRCRGGSGGGIADAASEMKAP